uniref:Ubiquitin-like protease family profile domain-containing protein n=1 Tax=Amphimedon queenslandica TaxID=400682 RepID=A0A1X7SY09_AMPQE
MTCAQRILQKQFPLFNGFYLTLKLSSMKPVTDGWIGNFLQICHCRSNHWITLSTIGCQHGEIRVYDSLYDEVDEDTIFLIKRLFNQDGLSIILPSVQKQNGVKDCGLFAIANATALLLTSDPSTTHLFNQAKLRDHLVHCLEANMFTHFPVV